MAGYDQLPHVAHVLNRFEVVINKGQADGIRLGMNFLIFGEGPEIRDPVTGQSLGPLEILRGHGKVTHIQDRLATVRSSERDPIYDSVGDRSFLGLPAQRQPMRFGMPAPREPTRFEDKPFRDPEIGDYARPV
jgi:hypothetical protein